MTAIVHARRRTRVKICGLTRAEDVALAASLGADAVGVVFAPSPRRVTVTHAAAVLNAVPPFVTRVGVFGSEEPAFIREAVGACSLDWVQLSDGRTTTDLWPVTARVIVVVHIHADATAEVPLEGADAILFDAPPLDGRLGGTGRRFDWTEARAVCAASTVPILVAGGLTPTNVGSAIATLHPWGVDVSSGVESSPGAKDPLQLAAFFQAVAAADANVRGDTESTEAMERAT